MKRLDARPGDFIKIGDVSIKLEEKTGRTTRMSIIAPPEKKIELKRASEVLEEIAAQHALGIAT